MPLNNNAASRILQCCTKPCLSIHRKHAETATHAFSVSTSTVWNSLPEADSLTYFIKHLKTHILQLCLSHIIAQQAPLNL